MQRPVRPLPRTALVAALHLPPSLSYPSFPGTSDALALALADMTVALEAGADAILLENELDKPHTLVVNKAQVAWLSRVCTELRQRTTAPVGINVQRIDWEATLALAAACDLDFVRLDVFVDRVRMQDELVEIVPAKVRAMRAALGGEYELFADVHVKHAELLDARSLGESVALAVGEGASGVIISGPRTGHPPSEADLAVARHHSGGRPVLIGSGLTAENAAALAAHADMAIVGTSLMEGGRVVAERAERVVSAWSEACASRR